MRILLVSPYFYPEGGGLGLYAFNMAKVISKKNDVVVLCSTKNDFKTRNFDCTEKRFKIIRLRPDFFISNTPINFNLKKQIEIIVKEENIDLINAHTPVPFYADVACLVAKKYNLPFVLNYHSSSLYKKRIFLDLMAFFYEILFESQVFLNSNKIILASSMKNIKNNLTKHLSKVVYIPPCVNMKKGKNFELNHKKEILFVAQLSKSHEWKGLENLIRAFKIFVDRGGDCTLSIVGGGNKLDSYKKLVRKLGLEEYVQFFGNVNNELMCKHYERCSFVVVPSVSNVEGTPTVMLEAITKGKPIIGGNVGGILDVLIENRCGMIVNAKNIDWLADAMYKLNGNIELYTNLSKNCLRASEKFNTDVFAEKIEREIEK